MGEKIKIHCSHTELRDPTSLVEHPRNYNTHPAEQIRLLAKIIKHQGWRNPITVSKRSGFVVKGHGRLAAAMLLKTEKVPVDVQDYKDEASEVADMIADNRIAELAEADEDALKDLLVNDLFTDFDLELTGFDPKEIDFNINESEATDELSKSLSERFLISPFTVLNAREGWWQDRKRAWIALGIQSEVGRNAATGGSKMVAGYGENGRETGLVAESDTSIFDPVLCELAYLWFSPKDSVVLDPFAGGSVRGIVASKLGRQYIGSELRKEQVEANRDQANLLCKEKMPTWISDDSRNITSNVSSKVDMVFSCPPYADLEVYSDDPNDLSTLNYEDFRDAYFKIIKESCSLLKDNSFACFVVGEVRDKKGNYYDFVGDTVQAFKDAGLEYYNEAILVTSVGSLPIRVTRQFNAGRKLGKTHQNVLIFVKGDGKKAAKNCGEIEVPDQLITDSKDN